MAALEAKLSDTKQVLANLSTSLQLVVNDTAALGQECNDVSRALEVTPTTRCD